MSARSNNGKPAKEAEEVPDLLTKKPLVSCCKGIQLLYYLSYSFKETGGKILTRHTH